MWPVHTRLARAGAAGAFLLMVFGGGSPRPADAALPRPPVVAPRPATASWHYLRPELGSPVVEQIIQRVQQHVIEQAAQSGTIPQPLAVPNDAQPLPKPASPLDELIQRYLGDQSSAEREVWREELKDLPLEIVKEILAARQGLNSQLPNRTFLPPDLADPFLASETPRILPESQPATPSGPRVPDFPAADRSTTSPAPHAAPRDITLQRLEEAEQALLHNIANASTPGFRHLQVLPLDSAGTAGIQELWIRRSERPGAFEVTDRAFDLAIAGPGYFRVQHEETVALTRRGTFQRGRNGQLVLNVGGQEWSLFPAAEMPADAIELVVDGEGRILCHLPETEEPLTLGQIQLARPLDAALLKSAGGGLLAVPHTAGEIQIGLPGKLGFGEIRSGVFETSNVELDQELAHLERIRLQIAACRGSSVSTEAPMTSRRGPALPELVPAAPPVPTVPPVISPEAPRSGLGSPPSPQWPSPQPASPFERLREPEGVAGSRQSKS